MKKIIRKYQKAYSIYENDIHKAVSVAIIIDKRVIDNKIQIKENYWGNYKDKKILDKNY